MPIAKKYFLILSVFITLISNQYVFSQFFGWTTLGTNLNNGTNGVINVIVKYNNLIIVGGYFSRAGTINVNNIAAWNGSSWSSLGTGVDDTVNTLNVMNGNLFAGGKFTHADGYPANYIAKWNGSAWSPVGSGMNNSVLTCAIYNGKLIAGGRFSTPGNYISSWDGNNWVSLSTGVNNEVIALYVSSGNLYAGGKFTTAGGISANKIAVWNNTTWSSMSQGMNDDVYAITGYGGWLVAGGSFTQAGGNNINYLAEWNGLMWTGLPFQLDSAVYALTYYSFTGSLIVGGSFRNAGNLFVNRICKWDGNGCQRMITGMNNRVNFLTVIDTNIYAGGDFSTAGGDYSYHASVFGNLVTHQITGTARYKDNHQTLHTGLVKAERLDVSTREVIVIDSAYIQSDGTYLLPHGIGDSTFVVLFPNDELQDSFIPTYYDSSISWVAAKKIFPVNNLSLIDIYVDRITIPTGTFSIGGHVFLNYIPPFNQPGFPYSKDAIVYAKQGNTFKRFAISDSTESYILDSLIPGTYDLYVDRIGYTSAHRTVTLSTFNIDTIDFYLDTVGLIGIHKISLNVPKDYRLYQNYPNPFNPSTNINFDIGKKSFVSITIYNLLGQVVTKLVNENMVPGSYKTNYNASNISSGVYFYTLSIDGANIDTKKMIFLK